MSERKGIILAGGSGTRLHPVTSVVSKQLLPIYDKPMIYYPLSILMQAGIRKIAIISTPADIGNFERLLGNGNHWGLHFEYVVQERPLGLAHAFHLTETFIEDDPSCLILGDNIFYGSGIELYLAAADSQTDGASVFGYRVHDPERYGVVEFDHSGRAISIEEKPKQPKSNFAVTGLYFYDHHATTYAREIKPSARGELEITDLNNRYLTEGKLTVQMLDRGFAWLDTGTHDSLLDAGNFIATLEKRQGVKAACVEEIAYRKGFISQRELLDLAKPLEKSGYGEYLYAIASESIPKPAN